MPEWHARIRHEGAKKIRKIMTTIHDVAKHAGVSAATVSRVLNGRNDVNPEMASQVIQSVKTLGYRRNGVARSLRRRTGTVWALIISDVESSYFTSLVRGVETVARTNGFSVVLCNSRDDVELEAQYIEVALSEQMSGVILSPARPDTDISRLIEQNVPVVTIDRRLDHPLVNAVVIDNVDAAAIATSHLIEGGFMRIACITGPTHISTAIERLEGYRLALKQHGLAATPHLEKIENYREDGGYRAVEQLLSLPQPPDALLTANGLLTVGAMRALHDRGIIVPDQMGIVGFDDSPWLQITQPPLSAVEQPADQLGRRAAQLLLNSRPADPSTNVLSATLVIRASSRR
jgi:LacI family transcriptional regulator